MSVTIASLEYQNPKATLARYISSNLGFLRGWTIVDGVKGKGNVVDIDVNSTLLKAADCVEDVVNTEIVNKSVELIEYNISFPVTNCELDQTWLAAWASKYRDEEEVYIETLFPFLAEKLHRELRTTLSAEIITEATADADVQKVTITGTVNTPATAYASVLEFIAGFPAQFITEAHTDEEQYYIFTSPEVYKNLLAHLSDKVDTWGGIVNVGGYRVRPNAGLTGKNMICTKALNLALFIDDVSDLNTIKTVEKEWLNTTYITGGLSMKATYLDPDDIIIGN